MQKVSIRCICVLLYLRLRVSVYGWHADVCGTVDRVCGGEQLHATSHLQEGGAQDQKVHGARPGRLVHDRRQDTVRKGWRRM